MSLNLSDVKKKEKIACGCQYGGMRSSVNVEIGIFYRFVEI